MSLFTRRDNTARPRPPLFNALATLGGFGHNAFERWAGVGVFLEPELGRRATNVLWSLTPVLMWRKAFRNRPDDGPALAFNAGIAVASVLVHFTDWPWSLRYGFLPWLDEAEGLHPNQLPAYNIVLWTWFAGGLGSILVETRRENLKFAAAGLAAGPLLLASARHHFTWAREQAHSGDTAWSSAFVEKAS
ncbi:hypothetical protein AB0L97_25320 [Nocardia sp. NPDC051911]|uniref:hypothetical protein n=1 Tax=Nocardia sp. NPDC051911 TaxID=3154648 RepID=UPI00343C8D35